MTKCNLNPRILTQNRLSLLLSSSEARLELYQDLLRRRLDRAERGACRIKIPRPGGLRLRLPGKPFHATPEFFFQESGSTQFDLPQEKVAVRAGDAFVVPAWMPHGEHWSGRSFLNLIVMFQRESFSLHLGYLDGGRGPLRCGPVDRFPSVDRFAVIRYAEEMAQAEQDNISKRLLQGLYIALLARLIHGVRPSRLILGSQSGLVMRCKEMIDVYSSRMDFSVIWLARELGCSPDHLSRRFRAQTGYRIMEIVHRQRIEHARRLLHDPKMAIAEISWACGFSQPSYFNHIFKALIGTTPKAFRVNCLDSAGI